MTGTYVTDRRDSSEEKGPKFAPEITMGVPPLVLRPPWDDATETPVMDGGV